MKIQSVLEVLLVTLSILVGVSCKDVGATCEDLLKYGMYDISSMTMQEGHASSFKQWFCQKNFSSKDEAERFAGAMTLPIDVIPIKLGAGDDHRAFMQSYAEFCADTNATSSTNVLLSTNFQKINTAVVTAFNDCINRTGLHAWIEQTKESDAFYLKFRYQDPKSHPSPATIQNINSTNAECKGQKLPFTVAGATRVLSCKRDITKQSSIVITASEDIIEHGSYTIAKTTYPRLPEPQPQPTPPCNARVIYSRNSAYCSNGNTGSLDYNTCPSQPNLMRLTGATLSIASDCSSKISFTASAMSVFYSRHANHEGPWIGLSLRKDNAVLTGFKPVVEASVEPCGGSSAIIKDLSFADLGSHLNEATAFELRFEGGFIATPCQ